MIKPKTLPDIEYLHKILTYNEESGELTWNQRPRECFKSSRGWHSFRRNTEGKRAGSRTKDGISVYIDGETYSAHRIIFKMVTGKDPEGEIDHKDMDKTNNRFSNLRDATHGQNQHNTRIRKDNKTGFKGVTYDKLSKRYVAEIRLNNKRVYKEFFDTAEDAYRSRCEMTIKFHGEFARNE